MLGQKTFFKQTALHFAAANGHDSMVKLLVNNGADKEIKDYFGRTALHLAAAFDRGNTITLLVNQLEVDREAKYNRGWTALHCAASLGHKSTVERLLSLGLNKENQSLEKQTALDLARRFHLAFLTNGLTLNGIP